MLSNHGQLEVQNESLFVGEDDIKALQTRPETQPAALDLFSLIGTLARTPNLSLEQVSVVERLVALQERKEAQGRKERFQEALRLCQMEMPRVDKNGLVATKTGQTIYSYAKLEDLDACIRPIYQSHGFTVTYDAPMSVDGGKIRSVARFSCAGHTEAPEITAAPSNRSAGNITLTDAQKVKQTITECRRHLLEMFFNIITVEAPRKEMEPISEDHAHEIQSALEEVGANMDKFKFHFGVEKVSDLKVGQIDEAWRMIEAKRKR